MVAMVFKCVSGVCFQVYQKNASSVSITLGRMLKPLFFMFQKVVSKSRSDVVSLSPSFCCIISSELTGHPYERGMKRFFGSGQGNHMEMAAGGIGGPASHGKQGSSTHAASVEASDAAEKLALGAAGRGGIQEAQTRHWWSPTACGRRWCVV